MRYIKTGSEGEFSKTPCRLIDADYSEEFVVSCNAELITEGVYLGWALGAVFRSGRAVNEADTDSGKRRDFPPLGFVNCVSE